LRCPLCQHTFESVDSLPVNFVLQWIEENNNDNKENQNPKKDDIQCDNCDEIISKVWCEKCDIYCCDACDSTIHSAKALRNHLRIGLREKLKKPTFTQCKNHLEENKFYCVDCRILICSVCVVDDHPTHKTMSVFKYGDTIKNDLKNTIITFSESINYYKEKETIIAGEILKRENEKDKLIIKLNEIDEDLKNKKNEQEKFMQQRKRAETSQIVLTRSVEEMRVMELMNKDFIELMKTRIKKIHEELSLLKYRLENEKLVKERKSDKERIENDWTFSISKRVGYNATFSNNNHRVEGVHVCAVGSIPFNTGVKKWNIKITKASSNDSQIYIGVCVTSEPLSYTTADWSKIYARASKGGFFAKGKMVKNSEKISTLVGTVLNVILDCDTHRLQVNGDYIELPNTSFLPVVVFGWFGSDGVEIDCL
jgi:hypothetical protein